MRERILVVDDERAITDILKYNLEREGFDVSTAEDGEEGLSHYRSLQPDLLLLDIMMPKMDGLQLCKTVRGESAVPIIMLTAKAEEVDKVLGLEFGADDYITKPFSMRELVARVKANLRRTSLDRDKKENVDLLDFGQLQLNLDRYEVRKRQEVLELTVREYELLKFLAVRKDQIFSREQLLEQVWGYEYYGDVRTVDVTVRRLREKVEDDASSPEYIQTKRGVGYYFKSKKG
ncbi:response regulator [Anaerotalea alkaliphila]|uniref:Stage 0 sporulation protein A homolog n=1 Tax=Anaerotalea alkaliphila TaxID=2662126 RepID=A0A7X5HTL5_9FIRM|nr:response regulator [Anaerotalea alkaliphila]NDL66418.1 response regulator transcription factor [Anaerotalea alkaliphila]